VSLKITREIAIYTSGVFTLSAKSCKLLVSPRKAYVRLKKVWWVDTTKIRLNIGGSLSLHILSATNWWNTSRMFGSRSWVKRRVSKVELYLSTCSWCNMKI